MPTTDNKADWSLVRIVNDVMATSGRWNKPHINKLRYAARRYERFRGCEQTAGEVTVHLLEKYQAKLLAEGLKKKQASMLTSWIGTIVRQADPDLLPNRKFSEYSKPEEGDLLYVMENEYFPARSKIASDETERQYKYTATRYSKFLGRRATLGDLNDHQVGKWMRSLRKDGLAPVTINGYVTKLRAFWSWCAKKRIVEEFPTIEDFPEPVRLPDAYSEEESRRLIAASANMEGEILGVPAAAWWEGLHLVAFDSAERTSAMLDLEWRYYNAAEATLEAPAHIRKGGRKPLLYHLKPRTVAILGVLRATGSKKIFPWPWDRGTYYNRYKKLLKLADIEHVPHRTGLQKVRRTFASHIEANGGNATMALAHTSRRLTEKSYLDPRVVKEPAHNRFMFDL